MRLEVRARPDAATTCASSAAKTHATIPRQVCRRCAHAPWPRNSFSSRPGFGLRKYFDGLIEAERNDRRRRAGVVDRDANAGKGMAVEKIRHHRTPHVAESVRRCVDFDRAVCRALY